MRKLLMGVTTFAVLAFAPASGWATVMSPTGVGFSILDNVTDSETVTVAANEEVVSLSLALNLAHSFVGDLVVKLAGPGGAMADIMVRTGQRTVANAGDASDLGFCIGVPTVCSGTSLYTFEDGGSDFWAAAETAGVGFPPIPSGTYAASSGGIGLIAPATPPPVSLNTIFGGAGSTTMGDWTLSIEDAATGDVGFLGSWGIVFTTVCDGATPPASCTPTTNGTPVPGTLLLLLAGLAGLGRVYRVRG